MKYLLIALLFAVCSNCCFAQEIKSIDDIKLLVSQINNMNLKTQYEYSPPSCDRIGNLFKGSITYTFMCDSAQRRLRKVIVKDDNYKQTTDYYFNNDQLLYIKSRFGITYFYDLNFSVGTTWKDENDIGLLKLEQQMATAYKFLIMYKRNEAEIAMHNK